MIDSGNFVRTPLRYLAVSVLLAASACAVPNHMHVTEGSAPQNIDTEVRFRTTYYFRVFDFCWSANATILTGGDYRKIVPETDTLYRYRMTGKASALGNRIKFESGVLKQSDIEPFGTDVAYNADVNGFVTRTAAETNARADFALASREAKAGSEAALDRFNVLAARSATASPEEQATLRTAMDDALADFTGKLRAPLTAEQEQRLKTIEAKLDNLAKQSPPPPPIDPDERDRLLKAAVAAEVTNQVDGLRVTLSAAPAAANLCPRGEIQRKGFQIMGPEGMRPFDQNKRLIMAMYTSAKPLTETLDEYSGRILKARMNPSEQLLPLARETTRIVEAQRALDAVLLKLAAGPAPAGAGDGAFASAITAFDAGEIQ